MQIAADTHVHVYPFYDLAAQFDAAMQNLPRADVRLLCLTERQGQHEFQALRSGDRKAEGWTVEATDEAEALRARGAKGELFILAGRQIVTAEKLEVLALGRDLAIPDGLPLADTLARVRDGDAIPVLPWGLGKWWGRRGTCVQNCLDTAPPGDLVFADTSLRPAVFPEPALLRSARSRGFSILHGTDPLPRSHEETLTGRWATVWEIAEWDASHPAAAWRRIVRDRVPCTPAGRRCSLVEAITRIK